MRRVAGARGRRVLILDHAKKPAEKIRISGGGRCNFTNIHSAPTAFLSGNRHFCKSAFSRYTQDDFIALVKQHGIAFHEKKLGQLFCDDSAQQIIDMLLAECASAGAELRLRTSVGGIAALPDGGYRVEASCGVVECASLVIATGGLSIPKIGATRFGYDVARQFGLEVTGLRPALVPLTFQANFLERCKALSGLSVDAEVRHGKTSFREGLLFTHRGLSGPSVLQISSYWDEGEGVSIDLAPGIDIAAMLTGARAASPKREVLTELAAHLPKRLAAIYLTSSASAGALPSCRRRASRRRATGSIAGRSAPAAPRATHSRGHARRGRCVRTVGTDDGGEGAARPLFHRRGGGCDRPSRRLQFPVGLVLGLRRGRGGVALP